MINKAFKIVCAKVQEAVEPQGFKMNKVDSSNENEMVALFTSENVAYSVIYYIDKMHMVMRACAMTEDGPDNEWKTMATWMFNPETDTEKEAQSIGNDFVDCIGTKKNIKRVSQTKKKKSKGEEATSDPVFLLKRFVKYFPELKDEIREEEENYSTFRAVTFTKEHVVSRVNNFVATAPKGDLSKFMGVLSAQYLKGDPDTRAIITIVILNSIDDKHIEKITPMLSDELATAFKCAHKYKGKTVKPEKAPKRVLSTGNRLGQ